MKWFRTLGKMGIREGRQKWLGEARDSFLMAPSESKHEIERERCRSYGGERAAAQTRRLCAVW